MSITKDSPPRTLPRGESLKLIIATAIYLFIFRLAPAAFASSTVTVNEICPRCDPEWVELYNNSNNPISLENWQLKDSNSSSSDDITLIGSIQPNSFLVFDHDKGWLNDSGDSITLIDSNGNSIDSYSYPSATENKTFSRIPDGTGEFQNNTVSTKSSANQAIPTSTPRNRLQRRNPQLPQLLFRPILLRQLLPRLRFWPKQTTIHPPKF